MPRIAFVPRSVFAGGGALAACCAVLVAVLLVTSSGSGTRVYGATVGEASVHVTGSRIELVVNHLPQPTAGHIYEVWLQHGDHAPQPTKALFDVNRRGQGDVIVPGDAHGTTAVLVTAEPAGGSPHPTTKPVVIASLAS